MWFLSCLSSALWINLQQTTFDSFFQHQSPSLMYSSCEQRGEKKKMQGLAKIRSDLLHQSLTFNQPTKRHLISMLMTLTRSLLVQRCLYAAWLERNNNGVPIRGRRKSPTPHAMLTSCSDPLSLPNLISYRIGDAGRHQRGTYTHTQPHVHHTSLGWLSGPVAFTALDWRMELLNQ